jgi:hypothetical protein
MHAHVHCWILKASLIQSRKMHSLSFIDKWCEKDDICERKLDLTWIGPWLWLNKNWTWHGSGYLLYHE